MFTKKKITVASLTENIFFQNLGHTFLSLYLCFTEFLSSAIDVKPYSYHSL